MGTEEVLIAVDPHKGHHTLVVLDVLSRPAVEEAEFANTHAGYREMVRFARRWGQRRWAVEGCHGAGRFLAQRLVARGEVVVDVPAKLAARVRVFSQGHGRKTDRDDAVSIGLAALASEVFVCGMSVTRVSTVASASPPLVIFAANYNTGGLSVGVTPSASPYFVPYWYAGYRIVWCFECPPNLGGEVLVKIKPLGRGVVKRVWETWERHRYQTYHVSTCNPDHPTNVATFSQSAASPCLANHKGLL